MLQRLISTAKSNIKNQQITNGLIQLKIFAIIIKKWIMQQLDNLSLSLQQIFVFMESQKTPGLELRNKYTRDPPSRDNHSDDAYLNKLKQMGVECHPSVSPAYFLLKNGLQYPGMKTDKIIQKDEILVRVPQRLILSSMKALQEPALQQVYEQQFYKVENCWEDRVLLTYCLYLLSSKSTHNIFYEMIQHMSKDIDVAFCWPEQQLDLFKDATVKNAALIDIKSFEQQWNDFQKIQKNYAILQAPQFSIQNYRWIFIHITSRCFGKAMDYTSFVPFCQFFNHHSSSVYYQINLPKLKPKDEKKQEEDEELSSNGSYESQDYIEEGQFAYQQIQTVTYKWGQNQCLDLNKNQKKQVVQIVGNLLQRAENQIDWKDFSILFVGHFIMRAKIVQNQYIEGRKNIEQTLKTLNSLKQILQKYIQYVKQFYKIKHGKDFKYKVKSKQTSQSVSQPFVRPDAKKYKPEYSNFYLKTGKNDLFLPNNQVFFCYGANSNRTLLLRYGFAIQGNKYEHFWLSYPINDYLKQMPALFGKVMDMGISIKRKYKINYTRLNMDLIVFFRLNSWNLYSISSLDQIFFVIDLTKQQLILQQIVNSLQAYLQIYIDEDEQKIKDKQLNYHKYFIGVYHLEKKRILQRQIQIFQKLIGVLKRLENGDNMQGACVQLTAPERYMCKQYLQSIVL